MGHTGYSWLSEAPVPLGIGIGDLDHSEVRHRLGHIRDLPCQVPDMSVSDFSVVEVNDIEVCSVVCCVV